MRATMVVLLAVVLAASCAQGAQQFKVKGKVDSVTLYRGQALVTRAVPFNAPAGAVQLTVTDLPESVLSQSLFASAGKGVQVRAVRFRTFATGKAPQAEVRKLDDQIAELEKKTRENESQQTLLRQLQSYLGNLQSFVAPSVKVELSKGVLNADTLAKITDMVFQKHGDLSKQALALAETSRQLKEQLALLQRKRHELTRSHSKTTREAVVFLEKMNGGKGDIQLHYLVSNATWEPTYNLRAKGDMRNVDVEYSALAQQMSGEDWDDVKLTLSTAAAQMVADGPSIAPLFVRLSRTPSRYGGLAEMERRYRTSQTQLRYQQEALQKSAGRDRQIDANWEMNVAANEAQSLELIAPTADMYLMRKVMGEASGGLSVNYKLEGKVSLASRRERQMVEIKKLTLPATFYNEAAPLLRVSLRAVDQQQRPVAAGRALERVPGRRLRGERHRGDGGAGPEADRRVRHRAAVAGVARVCLEEGTRPGREPQRRVPIPPGARQLLGQSHRGAGGRPHPGAEGRHPGDPGRVEG